jgi:hypothetical protein
LRGRTSMIVRGERAVKEVKSSRGSGEETIS